MLRILPNKYSIESNKYGCKITKFHKLLHTHFYTRRHEVWSNFDGSIGERMGKELVKNMAMTTNKVCDT